MHLLMTLGASVLNNWMAVEVDEMKTDEEEDALRTNQQT